MVDIKKLREIVGEKAVITDRGLMQDYLFDESVPAVRTKPAANVILVKPGNSQEILAPVMQANEIRPLILAWCT